MKKLILLLLLSSCASKQVSNSLTSEVDKMKTSAVSKMDVSLTSCIDGIEYVRKCVAATNNECLSFTTYSAKFLQDGTIKNCVEKVKLSSDHSNISIKERL